MKKQKGEKIMNELENLMKEAMGIINCGPKRLALLGQALEGLKTNAEPSTFTLALDGALDVIACMRDDLNDVRGILDEALVSKKGDLVVDTCLKITQAMEGRTFDEKVVIRQKVIAALEEASHEEIP